MKHIPMGRRRVPGDRPASAHPLPRTSDATGSPGVPTPAFDVFIDRGLRALYDRVLQEQVPEEWLKLIEDDRKK